METQTSVWTLPVPENFSLRAVTQSHGWAQIEPFTLAEGGNGFSYIDHLASGRVIAWQVDEGDHALRLSTRGELTPIEVAEIEAHAAWMLGLDQDLSPFYALAAQEPKLAHVPKQGKGRVLRSATFFEDVVKTILTTNTTWSGTLRMASALVGLFGEPESSQPARRSFPTPPRLAQASVDELRSAARLGYRAPYVKELAQKVAAGEVPLEDLKTTEMPTPELRKYLLGLKGVGGYAAANLLMLLGRYDDIPIDSWALKLVSHEWYAGQPVSPAEVKAAFARWGEYQGLAYWFWNWDYEL